MAPDQSWDIPGTFVRIDSGTRASRNCILNAMAREQIEIYFYSFVTTIIM